MKELIENSIKGYLFYQHFNDRIINVKSCKKKLKEQRQVAVQKTNFVQVVVRNLCTCCMASSSPLSRVTSGFPADDASINCGSSHSHTLMRKAHTPVNSLAAASSVFIYSYTNF